MLVEQDDKKGRGRPREFDREEALAAAIKLFWAKGYGAVSVAELCTVMDISPPSLYAAYGNKATLFIEAARQYENSFWEGPKNKLLRTRDLSVAIANYFQDACDILMAPTTPCGRMTALTAANITDAEPEVMAELISIRTASLEMFTERLRQAIQAGQIPADTDVPALAGCFVALLDGLAIQAREPVFLSQLKAMAAFAPRILPAINRPTSQPASLPAPGRQGRIALLTMF